jgi:hypothetical protein
MRSAWNLSFFSSVLFPRRKKTDAHCLQALSSELKATISENRFEERSLRRNRSALLGREGGLSVWDHGSRRL